MEHFQVAQTLTQQIHVNGLRQLFVHQVLDPKDQKDHSPQKKPKIRLCNRKMAAPHGLRLKALVPESTDQNQETSTIMSAETIIGLKTEER